MEYILEHFNVWEILKTMLLSAIIGFDLGLLGSHLKKAWPVTLAVAVAAALILMNSPLMEWLSQLMPVPFAAEVGSIAMFVGLLFGFMLSGLMRSLLMVLTAIGTVVLYTV